MKTASCVTAVVFLCLSAFYAAARDEFLMIPISETVNSLEAQDILRGEVKLFFGRQRHPQILNDLGERQITKKTHAFARGDRAACVQAFLGAVVELQQVAAKDGGNAIVSIHSDYKNVESRSDSQYVCGSGSRTARVVLTGRVVRIGGKM
jgi:uncharacterized protein YbjQ (UPF0145 family)